MSGVRMLLALSVISVCVAVIGLPIQAYAEGKHGKRPIRLATPPLLVKGADFLECTAVNLHRYTIEVNIQPFEADGRPVCGRGFQTIGPGEVAEQPCNSDIGSLDLPVRYCVFTYTGRKGLVLGTAQGVYQGVGGPAVAATPVPNGSWSSLR